MSSGITFGATITGGIQDIAGLLPLLGTEQCEEHIGSALTGGYLYAAATPMSIFGSLGVVRAGFKTFIACMPGRTWSGLTGAKILANMGFEPTGTNLSLVMIDKDDKDRRHIVETRLDELVKELHIDKSRVTVQHNCTPWTVTMILLTALLSSLSMIPYIHLNRRGSNLIHFSQWTFPILRAVGGFLTASMMQIVIERRIGRLTARHLAKINKSDPPVVDDSQGSQADTRSRTGSRRASHSESGDVEQGLGVPDTSDPASDSKPTQDKPSDSTSSQHETVSLRSGLLDCVFLILLLTGILSSVVGYVGCFSVVQNAKLRTGPLSWLCLEAGLSAIRMILWGWNPKGDDTPPLELVLTLDRNTILPTCNLDDAHILQQKEKVLPLTRANEFLSMMTSFVGLVERFTHPDLTLYYTLTRKHEAVSPERFSSRPDETGKRVLYITLFDHKERTTRVYTRDGRTEVFYSTESDVPLIDLRHGLLETTLDEKIISEDDLIADPEICSLLRNHYDSIMDQIHFTLGETHDTITTTTTTTTTSLPPPPTYIIENKWTMKAADTEGARERKRREEMIKQGSGTWGFTVETGQAMEVDDSQPTFERDRQYFDLRRLEEMRQSLDAARGRWIDSYIEFVTTKTRRRLKDETTFVTRVDGEPAGNESTVGKKALCSDEELNEVVEEALIGERCLMEKLLVYEVQAWERLFWNRVKEFVGRNDVPESEKKRLTREWRGNCWRRLDKDTRAMDERMERAKAALTSNYWTRRNLESVRDSSWSDWQSIIEQLVDTPTPSVSSSPLSRFSPDARLPTSPIFNQAQQPVFLRQRKEMVCRLKKELADVEFRIVQGLDCCDKFVDDEDLLECRHFASKSLFLDRNELKAQAPLDFYSTALKSNNDVIHIEFGFYADEDYAWLANISKLPSITSIKVRHPQRLPIQRRTPLFIYDSYQSLEALEKFLNNDQSLAATGETYVFMERADDWTYIAVSFEGPSSGNLILRLKHRLYQPDSTLTVLGTSFTLAIPESLTIDNINLYPIGNSSSQVTFKPNTRNNVILQVPPSSSYVLEDLQLLDEDGKPYCQPSQYNIPATESDTHSMPDNRDSSGFESDALRTPDDRESQDFEPEPESPSSGHVDLVPDANPVVAAGYDVNLIDHTSGYLLKAATMAERYYNRQNITWFPQMYIRVTQHCRSYLSHPDFHQAILAIHRCQMRLYELSPSSPPSASPY